MSVDNTMVRQQLGLVGTQPVLNWVDADGYPASGRVDLGADGDGGLVITAAAGLDLKEGPASLMAHYHNERMWKMKSVGFRGTLRQAGEGWVFEASKQFGKADLSFMGQMRLMGGAKKTAARYLAKRNMERPSIPWSDIQALKKDAKQLGID